MSDGAPARASAAITCWRATRRHSRRTLLGAPSRIPWLRLPEDHDDRPLPQRVIWREFLHGDQVGQGVPVRAHGDRRAILGYPVLCCFVGLEERAPRYWLRGSNVSRHRLPDAGQASRSSAARRYELRSPGGSPRASVKPTRLNPTTLPLVGRLAFLRLQDCLDAQASIGNECSFRKARERPLRPLRPPRAPLCLGLLAQLGDQLGHQDATPTCPPHPEARRIRVELRLKPTQPLPNLSPSPRRWGTRPLAAPPTPTLAHGCPLGTCAKSR